MSDEKKTTQLIGAKVPDQLYQLINLYATRQDTSKSAVLRDVLLLWAEKNGISIESLSREIAEKYQVLWRRQKSKQTSSEEAQNLWNRFLDSCEKELRGHNIPNNIIQKIIKNIAQ